MQTRFLLGLLLAFSFGASASPSPNIVVILTDDQGYADFSFNPHHATEVHTPHMDTLAHEGISFSQAYTSGNVCSPTRAGLMLGQYQQRVGVYDAGTGGSGFDPTIPIFPARLPDTYTSGALGKWHLGLDTDYPRLQWHPLSRGFDTFYGFMGRGGHDYFNLRSDADGKFMHPVYRDKQRIHDRGYLTTRLSSEAVDFIHQHEGNPFFLYLAYNAVHAPAQAPEKDIQKYRTRYPGLSPKRATLMAMLEHLDKGVGAVVEALKEKEIFDDTLLFFLTDNGGARAMEASNTPLRGYKSQMYEGGHRTPFIVSWPERFKGGRVIDTPIISLDILPTALDALGQLRPSHDFDGRSLLPLIAGEVKNHHDRLFWSEGGSTGEWAVRSGDFKLIAVKEERTLYNLAEDPSESNDLMARHPDKARAMEQHYEAWLEQMAPPSSGHPKRWTRESSDLPGKRKGRRQKAARSGGKSRKARNTGK